MPLLSTIGAASASGFGFGRASPPVVSDRTIETVLSTINTIMNNENSVSPSVDQISNLIENAGLGMKVVASLRGGIAVAEELSGTNASRITNWGNFLLDAWNNPQTLIPFSSTSGFANLYPSEGNGYGAYYVLSMFISGDDFNQNGYQGSVAVIIDNDATTNVRGLFQPTSQTASAVGIDRNSSSVTYYMSTQQLYTFSDGMGPNSNGYHSTGNFSNDDGVWGWGTNLNSIDANGGDYLRNASQAFGIENANSSDTNTRAYWNFNSTDAQDNQRDSYGVVTVVYA